MIFYNYHLRKYPSIQTEDKIKLIYQGLLGPNHLHLNQEMVKHRIEKELSEESKKLENIYEWISFPGGWKWGLVQPTQSERLNCIYKDDRLSFHA